MILKSPLISAAFPQKPLKGGVAAKQRKIHVTHFTLEVFEGNVKYNTFQIPIQFGNSERIANPLLCTYASDKSHFINLYYGTV